MTDQVTFVDANTAWASHIRRVFGSTVADHLHLEDGFTIVAVRGSDPVGLISVYWQRLPAPVSVGVEGYVAVVEVRQDARRQGVATALVMRAAERAIAHGAYQLRAWSAEDRPEAIARWQSLSFGLCPTIIRPKGERVQGYFVTLTPERGHVAPNACRHG